MNRLHALFMFYSLFLLHALVAFKGEIFNIFEKGGEPYMGGLSILWGDFITPYKPWQVLQPKSSYRKTKTVDKDILITYGFSERKFSQPFITTSDLPQEQGIRNNSANSLFHKLLTNFMWIKSLSKAVAEKKFIEVFYVFLDHIILFDKIC